jgi:hypothetical protein
LEENSRIEGGIPTALQVAILLKRQKVAGGLEERFNATVEGDIDWTSSVFGRNREQDTVIFNPARSAKGKDWTPEKCENLGGVNLQALQEIVTFKTLDIKVNSPSRTA